ncbi:MAG: putative sensor domain DACNV-containing protein [Vicinamibacterales bacterium]
MTEPSYPAARVVATKVLAHFAQHMAAARARGRTKLAPEPDAAAIEAIVDAAFWASLRREEGATPKISLAFMPPAASEQPLRFARQLPLSAVALARLAPAVERPGIHLGVWRDEDGELRVWGTTRQIPALCFVLEVVTSGLLVIKHRGDSFGKFVNIALLEGDEIKIVDESRAGVPDCPGLVASLLGVDLPGVRPESVNVLVQLSASMRAHGRGGALLLIPTENVTWEESIVQPALYSVDPPFAELAELAKDARIGQHEWQEDLRRAVDALAGLTAVDGATLVTERYELIAFGTKITRRRGSAPVERVMFTEPVEGSAFAIVNPYQLGGTRHLSAAQFVHDQRDATALVASQDGRFTIFKWSPCEDMVHAHRVDALLL